MASGLYNFLIAIYGLLIRVVSLFNAKAKLFISGRKGTFEVLKGCFETNERPVAWFHVASLGEFEQAKPVIEAFREGYPDHFIYITFFSPSGYEQKKNYEGADLITYLPLDRPANAHKFMEVVQPAIVVFVKYEFWYNYLNETQKLKVPIYSISALFTPNHIFFKAHGGLHRQMLGFFAHIFVQNEPSKILLEGINIGHVSISGDTRFDRVVDTLKNPEKYPLIEAFKGSAELMIIGSSWPIDMELLYAIVNENRGDLKFVIAPHEVNEASVSRLEQGLSCTSVRITDCTVEQAIEADVLIINTIGMLSNIYQYGHFAYIGGAFGDGLHNILEAVIFGLPVIFGNRGLEKFPESLELAEAGGAFPIDNAKEMTEIFNQLYADKDFRANASEACKAYIEANTGATKHIMNYWKANYAGKGH